MFDERMCTGGNCSREPGQVEAGAGRTPEYGPGEHAFERPDVPGCAWHRGFSHQRKEASLFRR